MADVLSFAVQVRHGARNWACVSCARRGIRLGKMSILSLFPVFPANVFDQDTMVPWSQACSLSL